MNSDLQERGKSTFPNSTRKTIRQSCSFGVILIKISLKSPYIIRETCSSSEAAYKIEIICTHLHSYSVFINEWLKNKRKENESFEMKIELASNIHLKKKKKKKA